jgi:hypothetical protein
MTSLRAEKYCGRFVRLDHRSGHRCYAAIRSRLRDYGDILPFEITVTLWITVTLYHLHHFHKHDRRSWLLQPLNYDSAQRVRQPAANLRPALRAWPLFGAGCG